MTSARFAKDWMCWEPSARSTVAPEGIEDSPAQAPGGDAAADLPTEDLPVDGTETGANTAEAEMADQPVVSDANPLSGAELRTGG